MLIEWGDAVVDLVNVSSAAVLPPPVHRNLIWPREECPTGGPMTMQQRQRHNPVVIRMLPTAGTKEHRQVHAARRSQVGRRHEREGFAPASPVLTDTSPFRLDVEPDARETLVVHSRLRAAAEEICTMARDRHGLCT